VTTTVATSVTTTVATSVTAATARRAAEDRDPTQAVLTTLEELALGQLRHCADLDERRRLVSTHFVSPTN
jgi:hypothetical protein